MPDDRPPRQIYPQNQAGCGYDERRLSVSRQREWCGLTAQMNRSLCGACLKIYWHESVTLDGGYIEKETRWINNHKRRIPCYRNSLRNGARGEVDPENSRILRTGHIRIVAQENGRRDSGHAERNALEHPARLQIN